MYPFPTSATVLVRERCMLSRSRDYKGGKSEILWKNHQSFQLVIASWLVATIPFYTLSSFQFCFLRVGAIYMWKGNSRCDQLHLVSAHCNARGTVLAGSSTALRSCLVLCNHTSEKGCKFANAEREWNVSRYCTWLRSSNNTVSPGTIQATSPHCTLNSACRERPDGKIQEFSII